MQPPARHGFGGGIPMPPGSPSAFTTDFLNIFLFRNSATAVAGFLFISRPPAKLLKYFLETLASFRPARLPAPLTRNRARETHRPIKTQTRIAHSILFVCLFVVCFTAPRPVVLCWTSRSGGVRFPASGRPKPIPRGMDGAREPLSWAQFG